MLLLEPSRDRRKLRLPPLCRDAANEASYHVQHPAHSGAAASRPRGGMVSTPRRAIGPARWCEPRKRRRHHTDDGENLPVERHRLTDRGAIARRNAAARSRSSARLRAVRCRGWLRSQTCALRQAVRRAPSKKFDVTRSTSTSTGSPRPVMFARSSTRRPCRRTSGCRCATRENTPATDANPSSGAAW